MIEIIDLINIDCLSGSIDGVHVLLLLEHLGGHDWLQLLQESRVAVVTSCGLSTCSINVDIKNRNSVQCDATTESEVE